MLSVITQVAHILSPTAEQKLPEMSFLVLTQVKHHLLYRIQSILFCKQDYTYGKH